MLLLCIATKYLPSVVMLLQKLNVSISESVKRGPVISLEQLGLMNSKLDNGGFTERLILYYKWCNSLSP